MKTEVFVEFFLARLGEFLDRWKDISVNDIFRLPKGFNLQAMHEKKGGLFSLNDLRTMIAEVSEKADPEELEGFFRGLIAAIKFCELSIDFDEKVSSELEHKESRGGIDRKTKEEKSEFPKSPRMKVMAEAWRKYSLGPEKETLKEALARSLNTLKPKEWNYSMTKALKEVGAKKVKVSKSDYGNFKMSAALKGLIKSNSKL